MSILLKKMFSRFTVLIALIFGLLLGAGGDLRSGELDDVRIMISGQTNSVKKWGIDPHIVIFHDVGIDDKYVHKLVQFINQHTGLSATFRAVPAKSELSEVEKTISFQHSSNNWWNPYGLSTLQFQGDVYEAHIFIFYVNDRTARRVMQATGGIKKFGDLGYAFFDDNVYFPCFFWTWSREKSIYASLIFIDNNQENSRQFQDCLYEELVQSFGIMADAPGTPYFTFDDVLAEKPHNNDDLLLRALYDERIIHGDDSTAVVVVYQDLIRDR